MSKKEIKIDDFTLGYYENEIIEDDCLILLHGNGMSSEHLSKIYDSLKFDKRIISIDIRGCGDSTKGTREIHIQLVAKDIITFLEAKQIKKATFIGYSDGANIAMLISKFAPQKVDKLVLICGNYNLEGICLWFIILLRIFEWMLKVGSKFSNKIEKRLEVLNLIFDDMELTDGDLENIKAKVLVLYAGIDVIHKDHSRKIGRLIQNSKIKQIKTATHENIVRNKEALKDIRDFVLEV
ncbi:MAG: alpha/beta fold hydrolase [Sarcina sp.]